MKKTIFIVGGGASGLFAAIHAAKNGCKVVVLEANARPCKKILVTGNGRCNLTNENVSIQDYYCKNQSFIEHILQQYTNVDTIKTFSSFGIITKNKNGYYYPNSMQAQTIADALIRTCKIYDIEINTDTIINEIHYNEKNQIFSLTATKYYYEDISSTKSKKKQVINKEEIQYQASKVIIACGSNAGLKTTDTDPIINCLKQMNHTIFKRTPALCSLYISQSNEATKQFFKKSAGIRTEIKAKTLLNNVVLAESNGELQITEYGLSGIVIFQLSSIIGEKILFNKNISIVIDFLPDQTVDQILVFMDSTPTIQNLSVLDFLSGLLNNKLSINLLSLYVQENHKDLHLPIKNLSRKEIVKILNFVKNCEFNIDKTNDLLHAQVSHGGVSVDEINSDTMESKKYKGLYFAGEIIDVDGICGGYNLQFAWSTGAIAGRNVAND